MLSGPGAKGKLIGTLKTGRTMSKVQIVKPSKFYVPDNVEEVNEADDQDTTNDERRGPRDRRVESRRGSLGMIRLSTERLFERGFGEENAVRARGWRPKVMITLDCCPTRRESTTYSRRTRWTSGD